MSNPPRIPLSGATAETKPYWEAAQAKRLLYKICDACGEPHFYPRNHCPFCFSETTRWAEASGRGRIYSFSLTQRASVPYVIAYVRLDEGPIMMTNIVDCPPETLAVEQAVVVCFVPGNNGQMVPMFTVQR